MRVTCIGDLTLPYSYVRWRNALVNGSRWRPWRSDLAQVRKSLVLS